MKKVWSVVLVLSLLLGMLSFPVAAAEKPLRIVELPQRFVTLSGITSTGYLVAGLLTNEGNLVYGAIDEHGRTVLPFVYDLMALPAEGEADDLILAGKYWENEQSGGLDLYLMNMEFEVVYTLHQDYMTDTEFDFFMSCTDRVVKSLHLYADSEIMEFRYLRLEEDGSLVPFYTKALDPDRDNFFSLSRFTDGCGLWVDIGTNRFQVIGADGSSTEYAGPDVAYDTVGILGRDGKYATVAYVLYGEEESEICAWYLLDTSNGRFTYLGNQDYAVQGNSLYTDEAHLSYLDKYCRMNEDGSYTLCNIGDGSACLPGSYDLLSLNTGEKYIRYEQDGVTGYLNHDGSVAKNFLFCGDFCLGKACVSQEEGKYYLVDEDFVRVSEMVDKEILLINDRFAAYSLQDNRLDYPVYKFCAMTDDPDYAVAGDLNQDTNLTVSDVVELRKAIVVGEFTDHMREIADINADGQISVTDVICLREYVARG